MDRDVSAELELSVQVPDGTYTANQSGTGVDAHEHRAATAVIDVGSYTDGTHTFEVQESDDNSTWNAVPDDRLSGTEPVVDAAGDANAEHKIGILSSKSYLRINVVTSGTTSGAQYGAYIVLTDARHAL